MRTWNVFFILFSCTWLCGVVNALKDTGGRDLSTNTDDTSRSRKHSGKHRQCRRRSVTRDVNALEECCRMFVNQPNTDNEGSAPANAGASKSQKRRQKRLQKWRAFCAAYQGGIDNGQTSGNGRSSTRRPFGGTTEPAENDDDDITDNEYMDEVPKQGSRPGGAQGQTGRRTSGNGETDGNSDDDRRGSSSNQRGKQSGGRATSGSSRGENVRDDGAANSGSRVSGSSAWGSGDTSSDI